MHSEGAIVILSVEDDGNDRFFIERALNPEKTGFIVKSVSDGIKAKEYLSVASKYYDRANYPLPGVVITDLKMPRCNGFELIRWLRNEGADLGTLPVVILSNSTEERDQAEASRLGVECYLSKQSLIEEPNQLCDCVLKLARSKS